MNNKPSIFYRALVSGSIASILSSLVVVERSQRENDAPFAALNAVSHWLHGSDAYAADDASWRHTVPAVVVHHASSIFWGLLYEAAIARIAQLGDTRAALAGRGVALADLTTSATVVTAVAALTDLRLVPPRLSPGFEHRLSRPSVALVYVGFGVGLLVSGAMQQVLARPRRPR